jgi:hypothetical protein
MFPVELRTPSGLYAGESYGYHVDLMRLRRVISRTAHGLFLRERGYRVPSDYGAAVMMDEDFRENSLTENLTRALLNAQPRVIDGRVFSYRVVFAPDHPDVSVWALVFYERIPFLAVTGPKGDWQGKIVPPIGAPRASVIWSAR